MGVQWAISDEARVKDSTTFQIFPSATVSPFSVQSSVLLLKQAAPGKVGTFWKFGIFCQGLCDWRSRATNVQS